MRPLWQHPELLNMNRGHFTRWVMWVLLIAGTLVLGNPFPGYWQNGSGAAIHFQPVNWPADAASPALCGDTCGDWKPYTRFGHSINDPRTQDPSNGGTAPQNYVNVSSSCTDKSKPSIYYYLYKATNPANDVVMFRWRVEQPAHNYATGPSAGNYGSANPWSSAQWTVLFNIDGSGYRSLAAHLNGSSGSPAEPIDMLAGIWSNTNNQSIDYSDPNIHLLAHNPTAFIGPANKLMNFHSSLTPDENWPNGAAETVWDYGTTRATLVSSSPCTEYFIDYQIPVAMLDASGIGGPSITRDTPISMLFCTANSLSNPFQKDCAINRQWTADAAAPAPFGDYLSFNKDTPYQQPIVSSITATPPNSCPGSYTLTAKIQDALALQSGVVVPTIKSVQFYYWYDRDGDGLATAADTGSAWTRIASVASLKPQTLNTWSASWDATSLPKGKYLIGVQAVDDATLLDDNMTSTGVDNRTFSYLPGGTDNSIYVNNAWASGQQAAFPAHSPTQTPASSENWYGNPDVTGTQVALVGTAINACGVAPTLTLSATPGNVATGGTVSYTLTLTNPSANTSAITVSSVGALLPTGFTYVNASSSGSGGLPSTNPTISGQQLTWTLGSPLTLAAGSSATLSFSATASSAAGTYNSTADAVTSFGSLTSSPAAVAVDSARVSLSMTPSAYSIAADGTTALIYTLRYANDSSVTVTSASISDTLPAGVTYVSCSGGTCGNSAGVVSWSLGTIGPGVSGTVTLTITVPSNYSSFSLANSATLSVTAPDSSTVTATASSTVAVTGVSLPGTPAFTLTKTASAASIAPGGTVTYTLTYNNYGSGSASSVVLTDTLPAGMTYSSCSNSCSNSSGTITWSIGTVAAGGSGSRTVTVTAGNPFTASNPATNNASISWSGGGPITALVDVGVTGQSCSTYYYKNTTANVGFDGTKRIANVSPVPVAGDTGTTVSATAPVSGSAFLEVLRFYQDPQTPNDVPFNGNITSSVYIDRANGQGLNIRTTIYDYNSSTGATTQLAQSTKLFSGSAKGLLTDTITPSGTLAKGHRLLWVYDARSNHASQTVQVEFQFGGTVTNGISGSTTFANSNAAYCVTPPASLTLTNQASVASITEATTPTITYTLNYANTGSASATNTTLVGALPTGFTGCQYSTNGSTWSTCSSSGGSPPSHSFALGTVAGGATGTVYVRGTVPSGTTSPSTLTSTSTISSDQTTSLNAAASTTVASASGGGTPALSLTLAANRSSAAPGASVVYTLTVINTGSAAATNVVMSNTVPSTAYYTYGGCTGSCGVSGSTLTWPTIASLAAGASQSVTYTMAVGTSGLPSGVTTISDNAAASGDSALSATSNTVAVAITGNPSLVLLNNAAPTSGLHPNDTVTYTLTIANSGAADANAVTVTNPMPANTTFGGTINATQGSASFDAVGNRAVYDVGTIAYGGSVTLTFTAKINYPLPSGTTSITSTATANASNASELTASTTVSATASPVLEISKTAPVSVAYPAAVLTAGASGTVLFVDRTDHLQVGQYIKVGSQVARITALSARSIQVDSSITAASSTAVNGAMPITIAYRNTGDADASNVVVRETLAAGFGYYSATPSATSTPLSGNSGNVDWTIGTLAAGASASLQVLAFPTGSTGSFTNTSLITASNASSATANAITSIGGLAVTKSSSTSVVSAGSTATYTIVITNSLGSPVTPVSITDVLPEGFSYYANSAMVGGVAVEPTFDVSDTAHIQPIWSALNIPANGSLSIQFQTAVSASTGAGTYQNEVQATAPAGVGVQGFDPLLTTAEDVTVLAAASGVVKGYVFARPSGNTLSFDPQTDTPLTGVRVEVHKSGADCNNPVGGNCMVLYTDSNGYFEHVMAAGAWIVSVIQNTGDLPGSWYQLAGSNNDTVTVPDQGVVWDYNGFIASVPTHTVTGTAGTNGSISPGSRTVNDGDTTTFTVTPDSGYNIDTVTGCSGSLSGSTYTTGTINGDCTVSATFAAIGVTTHTVTATAGANGSISPGSRTVNDGDTTTFTVTPDTGYSIDSVSGCGGSLSGSTFTTGAITNACTVTASFSALSYTVTATAGSGGSIGPASAVVSYGNATSFTVTPDSGFIIASVNGCGGSLSGSTYTTAVITSACTVSASFILASTPSHTVSTSAGNGGGISPASAVVADGSQTSFTITPNSGYTIASVSGCGGSLLGSTFITAAITSACTVSATFNINTYTVTASAGSGGSISPGSAAVTHGNTTAFTVTPSTGYHVASVTGCGGSLSGSTYTTAVITSACSVSATFSVNTYTVTASAGSGGSISPGSTSVAHGSTTSFTLTPSTGYAVASVSGCGGSLTGNTFTTAAITSACTVTASFTNATHLVSTSVGTGGTISPTSVQVADGNTTTLTLTPNSGYHVSAASGCGGALSGNTFVTGSITAACTVTASFTRDTYVVTSVAGNGGSVSPGSVTVNRDETASFTITPNVSHAIQSVTGCGGSLSGNTYTTAAVTAACTVSASFAVNAPVFGPAPPVSINARDLFTDVPKDIAPTAVDENGNALTVTLVGTDKLRPGRHLLTWTARDSQGRTMTQQQQLDIWPTVSLSNDLVVGFGSSAEFRVILNGDAPVYPFTVAYTVSGDGGYGTLHTLAPGSVTFTSGTEATVQFNALPQGASMPTKHLKVVLDPTANIGERGTLNISLLSSNAAPQVTVLASQADRTGTMVARDGGLITLHATISDPNPLDTHVLDWSYPAGAVVQISGDGRDLTLDPYELSTGLQAFSVLVTDSGTPAMSNRARVVLALQATSPALGNGDSNDNGIPDAIDGWGDSGNGIPNYLNRGTPPEVLPEDAPITDQYLVEGDAGVHLRIGGYAQLNDGGGVRLPHDKVVSLMGDDVISNVGGYFDLEAVELPIAGVGVRAVIPQRQPIPDHPDYRLWDAQQQHWVSFVENVNNRLSSAPGEPGYCPAPGSSAYTPGLTPGNWCVQIIVEDGGANDADHLHNGAMSISGGIAARVNSVVTGTSSGGGGGAMGGFVFVLSLLTMLRRSTRSVWQVFCLAMLMPFCLQAAEAADAASSEPPAKDQADCQPDLLHCFYVGGALTRVHNSANAQDMDARLAAQGYVTQTSLSGQSRLGGILFGGYRWRHVAAEIGYAHMGTMHTVVAGLTPVDDAYLRAISIAHPRSGKGPQLSVLGYVSLQHNLEAYGRIGWFYWRNTLSAEGFSRYADVNGQQLDSYAGLGLQLRPVYRKDRKSVV